MTQPVHKNEPRLSFRLRGLESLEEDLAFIGRNVGPRRGPAKRTQAEREDFCIRRWLIAAAVSEQLPLPVSVEAPPPGQGYPDYIVRSEVGEFGVEVTEAGDATWQAWLSISEPGTEPRLLMDNSEGYVGDEPERIVVRDVEEAIKRKATSRRNDNYAAVRDCHLLIYENSEGGLMCDRRNVVGRLRRLVHGDLALDVEEFQEVHLIFGDDVYLDIFGKDEAQPVDVSHEYADGWVDWLQAQARHLRNRNFNALDVENIAEELDALGRADQRALKSHLRVLLSHLLKWEYQPSNRTRSWLNSIRSARTEIEELLEENPSFENRYLTAVGLVYGKAVQDASAETGIETGAFPKTCPYAVDDLRDMEYLPEQQDGAEDKTDG